MDHSHNGHRQRLREKILSGGAEALQPHEIVEFLLFYEVARRNVNPLAHALINRFGTLQRLLSATQEEMIQVDGVTESMARWLHLVGNCVFAYIQQADRPIQLQNRRQTRMFLAEFLPHNPHCDCWALYLSATGRLVHMLPVNESPLWHAPENMRSVVSAALHCHAHSIILVRRHPECLLSEADVASTSALIQSLSRIQISLLEHVVMNPSGTQVNYATNPLIQRHRLQDSAAENSPLLAHWLDEI